ncbi:MAG: NUDIX domain-containing protein [Pseudomonadota bacterium]
MIHKACPVALHPDGAPLRIAAFVHPLAGLQIVKGTVEPGEHPASAAARELFEESGLETKSAIAIGDSLDIAPGQHWHFALCRVAPPVRDPWQHHCEDDGGDLFEFFWHPLGGPKDAFAEPFQNALAWIERHLT